MARLVPKLFGSVLLVVLATAPSPAQFIGAGSTVQGDILRGEGVFLAGAGRGLLSSSMAESIHVDTAIRLNEYMWNVAKNENRENAQHRAQLIARKRENYEKILKRIRENPTSSDQLNGDTLNDLMEQLRDPGISPSAFRMSPVPLPGETVRAIPFFYAPEDATFSMQRLSVKGKWPVGLRRDELARERRAYELALDNALEKQIEGKLTHADILTLERTVNDLGEKLDRVILPSKDKVYVESAQFLRRLVRSKELFKRRDVEQIMGEIDTYSGTTVPDLLEFMRRNRLRFGVPEIGNERTLYPRLHAALQQELLIVKGR